MLEREYDIAVIGGGPAGLISAITAAQKNISVVLFESKEEIGLHEHCAGLLSVEGLKSLNLLNLPNNIIQNNQIIGSKIYSPSGKMVIVEKPTVTAWVVDRSLFNKHLKMLAIKKGVKIETSSRVIEITRDQNKLSLKLGKKRFFEKVFSNLAILAEGRFPHLNKQMGLPSPERDKIVFTTQYIMSNVRDLEVQYVELYQDSKLAPHFFAWIIPINESSAKVGLGTRNTPSKEYLNKFILEHPIAKMKLQNAKITKEMSGAIPLSSFIKRTYTDNILVVGDAAGQTKSTTGGGVIIGGKAAQFAGEIATASIINQDYSRKFLSRYEKLWKRESKINLSVMRVIRSYLNSLNNRNIERLFDLISNPSIKQKISTKGDIDNQKQLVFHLLFEYRLWSFLFTTVLKWLLKSEVNSNV